VRWRVEMAASVLVRWLFLLAALLASSDACATSYANDINKQSGIPVLYCHGVADHVTHGVYWHPASAGLALPMAFRVEGWAMGDPWQGSQYLVSDGYGGGHVFLFGLNGNLMFDQGTAGELQISYSADDSPPQTWGVLDLRMQQDEYQKPSIVLRVNGIPVSRTFIPAGKTRTIAGSGSGTWWTCGSDHSNFKGWVAQLREWDTVAATDIYVGQAYAPLRILNGEGPAEEPVDLLVSYIQPTLGPYADMSAGYDSNGYQARRHTHPGYAYYGLDYGSFSNIAPPAWSLLPEVRYVSNAPFDPSYNEDDATLQAALRRGYTPKTPPASYKLYDSFSRADQEFAHRAVPDMGSIEASSIGAVQRWHTAYPGGQVNTVPTPNNPAPAVITGDVQAAAVGIFARSPVPLDAYPTIAWVANNSGNSTVKVTRRSEVGTSSDGQVGLVFRVQDSTHFWAFFYQYVRNGEGNTVDRAFYLYRYDAAGAGTFVAAGAIPAGDDNFTTLQCVTSGSSISCGEELHPSIVATTSATYSAATGVGIYWPHGGALSRHYDWTVL
jgi:hypothetical protein